MALPIGRLFSLLFSFFLIYYWSCNFCIVNKMWFCYQSSRIIRVILLIKFSAIFAHIFIITISAMSTLNVLHRSTCSEHIYIIKTMCLQGYMTTVIYLNSFKLSKGQSFVENGIIQCLVIRGLTLKFVYFAANKIFISTFGTNSFHTSRRTCMF